MMPKVSDDNLKVLGATILQPELCNFEIYRITMHLPISTDRVFEYLQRGIGVELWIGHRVIEFPRPDFPAGQESFTRSLRSQLSVEYRPAVTRIQWRMEMGRFWVASVQIWIHLR